MATKPTSGPNTAPAEKGHQFGTFGGVFTPCILTILGVILFMRANFVIGEAGILATVLILLLAKSITFLTALSTSGICTNMQVRGGGAYYLISRVLGPEFGGSIGMVLFLAQAVSVPFYVLGFTEALVQTFPALMPHHMTITFVTAGVLFALAYAGASWAIKVQYLIMAILGLSIVVFMGGALRFFSLETLAANWGVGYTPLAGGEGSGAGSYDFWIVFAIYFPAATGIMTGINMSGDLKDPVRSIPRGILAAIAVGFLVYLLQIIVFGGSFSRSDLIEQPYLALKDNALFGAGFLVAAGMFAATLSSGIGSFMAAPRVLQAVARDGILPVLRPFAKGSKNGDEPRPASLFTGVLTFGVLLWAGMTPGGNALNLVAGIITEFFLYTYGMLNVAAFIEAFAGNPSFRPRFQYFHWSTALAGALGCLAVALIINPVQATVAFALLTGLVVYMTRRELRTNFGDARRGFLYQTARDSLLRLSRMKDSAKNWRPTAVVFSGNPDAREALVTYAIWFEAGRGFVFLVNILEGAQKEYDKYRETARRQLLDFCEERDVHAFPVVVVDESLEHAMRNTVQTLSVGPIQPNLAVFGWSDDAQRRAALLGQFRTAQSMGMSLVLIHPGVRPFGHGHKRVDIWWRGMKNGALMLLLGHLLTRNWEWSRAGLRLLRVHDKEEGRGEALADLQQLIETARVKAEAKIVVSDGPFAEILANHSSDADCVILGFEPPEAGQEAEWYGRYEDMLCEAPTTVLVSSVGTEDLMA